MDDKESFKKDQEAYRLRILQEKYKPYLSRQGKGRGGIFTTTTRGNLLGINVKGRKIRDKTYDFRFDVRNTVRTALVDLQLFIETANDKDIDEVINRDTLEPILEALLDHDHEPNSTRTIISYLLIETGLHYLSRMNRNYITQNQQRIIDDAIELSKQLTAFLLPETERNLFSWSEGRKL